MNLSGGQKQRSVIARALVNDPRIIFADEPTGNLDTATGAVVEDILFGLHREQGITLIVVTHDEELAARCDRRIHIRDGRIVERRGGGGMKAARPRRLGDRQHVPLEDPHDPDDPRDLRRRLHAHHHERPRHRHQPVHRRHGRGDRRRGRHDRHEGRRERDGCRRRPARVRPRRGRRRPRARPSREHEHRRPDRRLAARRARRRRRRGARAARQVDRRRLHRRAATARGT